VGGSEIVTVKNCCFPTVYIRTNSNTAEKKDIQEVYRMA